MTVRPPLNRPKSTRQRRDNRSPEAQAYRNLYKTAAWRRIRDRQLDREPICRMCANEGVFVPATVCDHVTPHRGNVAAFWAGPFQSLCNRCHSSRKQAEEVRGFSLEVDQYGFPVDPSHPANR